MLSLKKSCFANGVGGGGDDDDDDDISGICTTDGKRR
jgi:hypothetical protein